MTLPWFEDPQYHPDNANNPYGYKVNSESLGMTYFDAPQSNSTMVSDNILMVKKLKTFVPAASVKEGRAPKASLMTREEIAEENNKGNNYKSSFQ